MQQFREVSRTRTIYSTETHTSDFILNTFWNGKPVQFFQERVTYKRLHLHWPTWCLYEGDLQEAPLIHMVSTPTSTCTLDMQWPKTACRLGRAAGARGQGGGHTPSLYLRHPSSRLCCNWFCPLKRYFTSPRFCPSKSPLSVSLTLSAPFRKNCGMFCRSNIASKHTRKVRT